MSSFSHQNILNEIDHHVSFVSKRIVDKNKQSRDWPSRFDTMVEARNEWNEHFPENEAIPSFAQIRKHYTNERRNSPHRACLLGHSLNISITIATAQQYNEQTVYLRGVIFETLRRTITQRAGPNFTKTLIMIYEEARPVVETATFLSRSTPQQPDPAPAQEAPST